MPPSLHAGVGRTDITPPLGTPLAGYVDLELKRRATAVRDRLSATALVFRRGGAAAALVSLDAILIELPEVQAIRRAAAERTGIDPEHIIVGAIQTHSAAWTQRTFDWHVKNEPLLRDLIVPRAVEAIALAASSLKPARVGVATTLSHVGVNRRAINADHGIDLGQNPSGPYDPTMTVLRIEAADGPLANVVHYGAHPTVLGRASTVISRDWPGVMVDRVEQLTGATTLYLNGAVGDVAPRTNSGKAVGDGTEAALWEAGAAAALDAMRAWRSIRDLRDLPLAAAAGTIDMPFAPLPPLDEARRQLADAEAGKDQPGPGLRRHGHWKRIVAAHEAGGAPRSEAFPQTLIALGPVAFVPFPGEPFTGVILRLREASPFAFTLGLSTTGGSYCYLPTREERARGGYEVHAAESLGHRTLVDHIDDVLIDGNLRLLNDLFAVTVAQRPRVQHA